MSTLVYVHGTNGSGKTTLARAVIEANGGVTEQYLGIGKCWITRTRHHVELYGKYQTACGGVDGIQPYSDLVETMYSNRKNHQSLRFAEGLVTPGLDTCQRMVSMHTDCTFILLATPVDQCIRNVLKRRKEAGNTKPYDPRNLHRKDASARSWAERLDRAGLPVYVLQYNEALEMCLDQLVPF